MRRRRRSRPIAIARTSLRRRPGTSQSAAAHRRAAPGSRSRSATSFRSCVRLCAVSSSSDWRRTMRPASGGSCCDDVAEEAEPVAEAARRAGGGRARHRPPWSDSRVVSPSSTLDDLGLRQRRGVHEEALDARALQQLGRAAVDELAREPRDRRRQRLEVRRQLLLELRGDVDVRVQLLDHRLGELVLDRRVRDQLLGGRAERLPVERLSLDPVREQADGEKDDAEDDEHPRDDDARPGGLRRGFGCVRSRGHLGGWDRLGSASLAAGPRATPAATR